MAKHQINLKKPADWLAKIEQTRESKDVALLQSALNFYNDKPSALLEKGLSMADILLTLGLDSEALTAGLLYAALQAQVLSLETLSHCMSEPILKLLDDILQIQRLTQSQSLHQRGPQQIENLRKLLLAMVSDVRALLILLAERIWQLHAAKTMESSVQRVLAEETADIYAPLANRLGIWQFKWELEDLCFRYLQPDIYKKIAVWLVSRRQEREDYIHHVHDVLTNILTQFGIKQFEISGRVKHIYSIHRKMQRKQADFSDIYDISALRVLVPTVDDCYGVLSVLTNTWQQVPQEFDDYISNPKSNGYRSIHVVVNGPQDKIIEIQIRTYQMHEESELGVAAHWRYKEGILQTSHYEAKIALLRQLMAWQKEVVDKDKPGTQATHDLFSDRIYVFTPLGDVIDLPQGATPLDFAYAIHSEVGHRCRGAKINKNIVPLTYHLQTGDRVEILTAKEPHPSRDWLNTQLGFLKTARARSKVQHWFKLTGLDTHAAEREKEIKPQSSAPLAKSKVVKSPSSIHILGVNNLLTQIAYCCKPSSNDDIIGYITRTQGIRIHKRDCRNIVRLAKDQQDRLIEVTWRK